jgi:hypothetical protein
MQWRGLSLGAVDEFGGLSLGLIQTAYKRNREQTGDGEQDDEYNHESKGTSLQ